jgi:hypothetical protein
VSEGRELCIASLNRHSTIVINSSTSMSNSDIDIFYLLASSQSSRPKPEAWAGWIYYIVSVKDYQREKSLITVQQSDQDI